MTFLETPSCFLAIPTDDRFEPVRKAILQGLEGSNIRVLEAATLPGTRPSALRGAAAGRFVERADLVIADVTGGDRAILYELGAADALRKPTLIIAQEHSDVPEELSRLQVILYKPDDVLSPPGSSSELTDHVRHWVRTTLSLQLRKFESRVS
jgi:hypothetical protein